MNINCKIKVKHNYKKLNSLINKLPQTISESVEDILKNIQTKAIRLEHGHNNNILVEMIDISTKKIKCRVVAKPEDFMSNGQSYLFFEYFGTGSKAEMDHVGTTKHFVESGYTEWLIPINKVERALNYLIVTIDGNQFYLAHGTQGNHFIQNAEFKSRQENSETIKTKIKQMLEEACK